MTWSDGPFPDILRGLHGCYTLAPCGKLHGAIVYVDDQALLVELVLCPDFATVLVTRS